MGESKRRKESDPLYGQAPKRTEDHRSKAPSCSADERGLIISNPMTIQGNLLRLSPEHLDVQELRFSLLYWDKLVWPKHMMLDLPDGPDTELLIEALNGPEANFLMQSGILLRPDPKHFEGELGQQLVQAQFSALKELDAMQPGQWALGQGENSLKFDVAYTQSDHIQGGLVELHRAIPIPHHDVPLQEILEFKHRRRDELRLLRRQFEALTSEIAVSDDPEATLRAKLAEVDKACANLLEVGREWRWPVKLGSWNSSLNFEPVKMASYGATVGAAANHVLSMNMPACIAVAATTALASTFSFKPSTFAFQGMKLPRHPYRYAYSIDAELR